MDKKDEIILQQLDVIRTMTENNLSRLGTDFWGQPRVAKPVKVEKPEEAKKAETKAEEEEVFYNLYLADHAGNEDEGDIVFYVNSHECTLNILCDGWYIWGLSLSEAKSLGIPCKEIFEDGKSLLCTPEDGEDYIEYAEKNILVPLSKVVGFAK